MAGEITAEELISGIDMYKEFLDFVSRRFDTGEQNASLQKQAEWLDEDEFDEEYADMNEDEIEDN